MFCWQYFSISKVFCRLLKDEFFKRDGFERMYICIFTLAEMFVASKVFIIIQISFVSSCFLIDQFCNYCPSDFRWSYLTALQACAVWATKDFTSSVL